MGLATTVGSLAAVVWWRQVGSSDCGGLVVMEEEVGEELQRWWATTVGRWC
jgi:hypothetical protein